MEGCPKRDEKDGERRKESAKKVETRSCRQDFGFAGRIFVLQAGVLFCRQDFCFAGRTFVLQAGFLFCGQDFSAKKSRTKVLQAGFFTLNGFISSVDELQFCSSNVVQWH